MKRIAMITLWVLGAWSLQAQDAEKVTLSQTPGKFEETKLTLKAGQPYIFEVKNENVDHEVGFVLAPKGKTGQEHHIQAAYLTQAVKEGETATSQVVTLEPGEYVYFCPLNPTPEYTLTVEE